MLGRDRHAGEAGLLDQKHLRKRRCCLNLFERNRALKRFNRREIDLDPIAGFFWIRIRIGGLCDLGDPHHALVVAAMIDERLVALFGFQKEIAGLEISDAIPVGFTIFQKLGKTIGLGFGLKKPVLGHERYLPQSGQVRQAKGALLERCVLGLVEVFLREGDRLSGDQSRRRAQLSRRRPAVLVMNRFHLLKGHDRNRNGHEEGPRQLRPV